MFNKEPAVFFKVIEEIVRAAIPLALIFGWVHWSEAQTGSVLLFVGVLAGGFTVLLTRSQTVSTETANKQIETAVRMPSTASVQDVIKATDAQKQ